MPDLASVHVQKALNSMSIALMNPSEGFLAARVCGERRVELGTDKFYVYGAGFGSRRGAAGTDARSMSSARVPGAEAAEVDYTLSTSPYVVTKYSYRDLVTDEEIGQADSPLSPLLDAGVSLVNRLRMDQEAVLARIIADPDNYPSGNKTTLTTGGTGTSWLSYTSANTDPLEDLRTGKEVLKKSLQRPANTLVLSSYAAAVLADHPAIKDIVKYTDPTYLMGNGLPRKLRDLDVVIAEGVYDTAAEGGTATMDYVFVDANNARACAIICYVPPGGVIGPRGQSSFLCFNKRSDTTGAYGISVRSYRDEKREGWVVEADLNFDIRAGVVDGSGLITGAYAIFDATV
jgi:hypothetical protein